MNQPLSIKIVLPALLGLLFSLPSLSGQNLDDALRYSQLTPSGSARVMGVGGAFGAMGGDFGVSGANISGLADYRSKELMFTLSYNKAGVQTLNDGTLVGDNGDGKETIIENLAFISHNKPYYSEKLVTSNFAIGLQQYSNYNQVISYETTTRGSLVKPLMDLANIDDYNAFDVELADLAGAIYYDELLDTYVNDFSTDIIGPFGNVIGVDNSAGDTVQLQKEQTIERSGRVNELSIGWAGKFRSSLNIGVGIGMPFVSYQEDKFYIERDEADEFPLFTQLNFNESFSTSGVGINLKLGLGYTVAKRIRLGVGWQSPSIMRLQDNFNNSLAYSCDDPECRTNGIPFESDNGQFDYRLRTPMKTTLSAGYLLNTEKLKGFFNVDFQIVDYTQNKFDFTFGDNTDPLLVGDENFENGRIVNELASTYNWAIGAELAYNKWRIRSGVNLQGNPFFLDQGTFNKIYAGGLGYRMNKIFFDLAYQYRQSEEGYSPYRDAGGEPVTQLNTETQIHKVALTLGIKI